MIRRNILCNLPKRACGRLATRQFCKDYPHGGYNGHTDNPDTWYFEEQVEFQVRGTTHDGNNLNYNCTTGKFNARLPRKPRRKIKDQLPEFPTELWYQLVEILSPLDDWTDLTGSQNL